MIASAASTASAMGPCEYIGNRRCKCNGPVLWHRDELSEIVWARAVSLAVAIAGAIGPF